MDKIIETAVCGKSGHRFYVGEWKNSQFIFCTACGLELRREHVINDEEKKPNVVTTPDSAPALKRWVSRDLGMRLEDCGADGDTIGVTYQFLLITPTHSYAISARPNSKRSYLGCIASARHPRIGETHTRGNDLADGYYSESTWLKIYNDIIEYENENYAISHDLNVRATS